jgi:hypothetical protein
MAKRKVISAYQRSNENMQKSSRQQSYRKKKMKMALPNTAKAAKENTEKLMLKRKKRNGCSLNRKSASGERS